MTVFQHPVKRTSALPLLSCRRNRAPLRTRRRLACFLAYLLSWLAGHGGLPWLIVRRGATKRQASPMAERCTWWSMQSSVLIPLASRGHMSASGSRGHTSIRARSRPPRRRRRRQDIVLSASASIHQATLRQLAELDPLCPSAGCHIRSEAAVVGALHHAQAGAAGAGLRSLPAG